MKNIVTNMFKNRTVGFWIAFVVGVIALLGAITYAVTDFGDPTFSTLGFGLLLAAGILQIVLLAVDVPVLMLVPIALIAAACGLHIYTAVPSITDVFNGIDLYGGNGILGIVFAVVFVVTALLGTVSCFMKPRKSN